MNGNLRPGEQFPVEWQISDPSDLSTTYYPQAVIKNARAGTTLQTINLTSQGGGRYSDNYQVPQDPSGLGFYISITLTVYTDTAHTVTSTNYQVENRLYKIKNELQNYGGGGGINYDEIREIVRGIIKKQFEELPDWEIKFGMMRSDLQDRIDTGFQNLSQRVGKVEDGVNAQPGELKGIQGQILALKMGMEGLKIQNNKQFEEMASKLTELTEQTMDSQMIKEKLTDKLMENISENNYQLKIDLTEIVRDANKTVIDGYKENNKQQIVKNLLQKLYKDLKNEDSENIIDSKINLEKENKIEQLARSLIR